MNHKFLGSLLILVALLVILAMIVGNHILWLAVDLAAVVVCLIAGISLLRKG